MTTRTGVRRLTVGALTLAAGLYVGHATTAGHVRPSSAVTCQEDEACWECETMGNRTCGADYGDLIRFTPGVVDLPDSWACYVRGELFTCQDVTGMDR